MKTVTIDGVECFMFLEHLALDKGTVINILAPVDATVPVVDRVYVNHRNWIGIGKDAKEEDQIAAREQAKAIFDAVTDQEVSQLVADAKESIKPTKAR